MRIEPVGEADVECMALAELHLRTALVAYAGIFPPDAPVPTVELLTERWRGWLGPDRPEGQEGFVAVDGCARVGIVVAGPDPDAPGVGHLSRLYVVPERWGQGIGRALHDAGVDHVRGLGFADATLWVLEANARARRWYEAIGWRATDTRQAVYPPASIDEVGYRLTL